MRYYARFRPNTKHCVALRLACFCSPDNSKGNYFKWRREGNQTTKKKSLSIAIKSMVVLFLWLMLNAISFDSQTAVNKSAHRTISQTFARSWQLLETDCVVFVTDLRGELGKCSPLPFTCYYLSSLMPWGKKITWFILTHGIQFVSKYVSERGPGASIVAQD